MNNEFQQLDWNQSVESDCRAIVRLAWIEDLADQCDWTTEALAPKDRRAEVALVAREAGVVAGLPAVRTAIEELAVDIKLETQSADGRPCEAGDVLASLSGSLRDLLTTERILLNLLGRLCGIATLTARYVAETEGTTTRIYDTRKTTPGWRRLEKYAVRCGGAYNHRSGLYDAVLIKDNHLAQFVAERDEALRSGDVSGETLVGQAVEEARNFLAAKHQQGLGIPIEIEVDTLGQLESVLPTAPDIVLLDNMTPKELREAVALRDKANPAITLEASGGVTLESLREVAATGVDRISVGALTHSARSLDMGLDWTAAL